MANEQFNQDIALEQALEKYGGEDDVYKVKLKQHVRDYLGYSNYVGQMNAMPAVTDPGMKKVMGGGSEQSYLHGDITPSGVRQLVGGGLDLRNQEMSSLQQLAKGADVAGKSKAANSEEAAKAQYEGILKGIDTGNYPDALTKNWLENPINDDGTFKTTEQFKETLYQHLLHGEYGAMTEEEARKMAEQTVNKYLQPDQQANLQKLYYQSIGYTEKESTDLIKYDRYAKGEMTESEASLYRATDPGFAGRADILKQNPGLQQEFNNLKADSENALPFMELKDKYPSIPETELKQMSKPFYMQSAQSDVSAMLKEKGVSAITEDGTAQEFQYYIQAPSVNEIKQQLSLVYQGALTPAEIDYLIWQNYLNEAAPSLNKNNQ